MTFEENRAAILSGQTVLGMEAGSTRIKAILLNPAHEPIAYGEYAWENRFENQIWTYHIEDVHAGVKSCYASLLADVKETYGVTVTKIGAIGVSGMMHGYLPFDKDWNQICEFRTWRNTITEEAAAILSERFAFNVPQRWSIAHLYRAMMKHEPHLKDIAYFTTLAGYIHYRLSGMHVLGVGEASGMFPIDPAICDYNHEMAKTFDEMASDLGYHTDVLTMMPKVLAAGDDAGALTPEGAAFLDESGQLISGIPLAPPEGDAGTGMTATNSVRPGTGNVSAGTSDFSMIVLEQPIGVHVEIDIVNTPDGSPAAMIHCNNCTSDINAWVALFGEFANLIGAKIDTGTLFTKLFESALSGDPDCGGLLSYNYLSGEGVTAIDAGRPLFLRDPDAAFNLPNFMRMHLMSAMATLTIGMDILTKEEHVPIKTLYGHGGFFKTPQVGARILSAAVNAPIQTMTTAGEGGAYGIALLAAYEIWHEENETLPDYLETKVFADAQSESVMASEEEVAGFARFLKRYQAFFEAERIAALTQG